MIEIGGIKNPKNWSPDQTKGAIANYYLKTQNCITMKTNIFILINITCWNKSEQNRYKSHFD
jgi:hypothetical protein